MRILYVLSPVLLSGCMSAAEGDRAMGRLDQLEARLVALETQNATLRDELLARKVDFDDLAESVVEEIRADPFTGQAMLRIGQSVYSVAQTTHGPSAVSFEDIKPLGSGSRVTIEVVNMSSVAWTDPVFNVNYFGKVDGEIKSLTSEIKLSKILAAGASNKLQIDLPNMKHDEVNFMFISLAVGGIRYKQ